MGALVIAALVAVARSNTLHEAFVGLVELAEPVFQTNPVVGMVLFVGLSALSALVAFFSTGVLVPVALGVWGPWGTGILLWVGWTLGGAAAYAVGRWLGKPALARLDHGSRVRGWIGRLRPNTPLALVALLLVALQSEISGVVLGMARYPFGRYVLALGLVEVGFAALTVAAGSGLLARDTGVLAGSGIVLVGFAAIALVIVHRRLPPSAPVSGAEEAEPDEVR